MDHNLQIQAKPLKIQKDHIKHICNDIMSIKHHAFWKGKWNKYSQTCLFGLSCYETLGAMKERVTWFIVQMLNIGY